MLREKSEDYKFAYSELKKFWSENTIDKVLFEQVFKKELFELKDDEILVLINVFVFSVSFNDEEMTYKVGKIYKMSKVNDNTLNFEEYNTSLLDSQIEWGVNMLEENREDVYQKGKILINSISNVMTDIKNNLEKTLKNN